MINLTKNNWLTTNIDTRRQGLKTDFQLFVNPYKHEQVKSFREECLTTAVELSQLNIPLYVGLSGGYDSECLSKVLLEAGVSFKAIIVTYDGNQIEVQQAFKFCDKQKIVPIILNLSEYQLAYTVCKEIIIHLNGTGIYSVGALVAEKYAKENRGILLTGDHIVGDQEDIDSYNYYLPEHDFYAEAIGFFTYRLEVVKAMLNVAPLYKNWIDYKHKVFYIEMRDKIRPKYNNKIRSMIQLTCHNYLKNVNNKHVFGKLEQLNGILNV